jgi:hypothetical protein
MSFFKYITSEDRVVSSTNLTEQISNISSSAADSKVGITKRDYYSEISSGSSNHTFDVTFGRTSTMGLGALASGSTQYTALSRSMSNYNQFAKILLGADADGNILKFSRDDNDSPTDNIMHTAYFVSHTRENFKDKIKPGTYSLEVLISGSTNTTLADKRSILLSDISGATGPTRRECASGEYGILYAVKSTGSTALDTGAASANRIQGLVFYEAGIAVISPSIFAKYDATYENPATSSTYLSSSQIGILTGLADIGFSGSSNVAQLIQSNSLGDIIDGFATRILTSSYQSTTEINSTIYFCRAFNSEFNYSSNPTYLSASEIRVKGGDPLTPPVSYITTVGLYDDKNQLLAVAKLSEPVKKTPETELIARVRLDF